MNITALQHASRWSVDRLEFYWMRRFGAAHILNAITPDLRSPRWLWTLKVKAWAREHDPSKRKEPPQSLKKSATNFLHSRHVLVSGQEKLLLALGCKRLLDGETAGLVWESGSRLEA